MSQRALPRDLFASLTGLLLCLATSSVLPSARAANLPAVSIGEVNVSADASSSGDGAPELINAGDSSALHGYTTSGTQAPGFDGEGSGMFGREGSGAEKIEK